MANKNPDTSGLKPFVKGDKRINRSGKPKNFEKLRKMAIKIAAEEAANTGMSRVELMFTAMASSKNTADRKLFLEYAYGKVKDEVDLTSGGEKINVIVKIGVDPDKL